MSEIFHHIPLQTLPCSQPGSFHFPYFGKWSSANFHFISKKPEVTVCAGHRPLQVPVNISMTWHSQIRLTRKYISFQFSLLVKFLLEFNIFILNFPKLLAGKGVHSGTRRKTLWSFYKYFMARTGRFSPKKTTCCFYEFSILTALLLTFRINQSLCLMNQKFKKKIKFRLYLDHLKLDFIHSFI